MYSLDHYDDIHFLQLVDRTWECDLLNGKWGDKTYNLYEEDFCKDEWDDTWTHSSRPTCDEEIAPIVSFYSAGSCDEICTIDMNQGRGEEYTQCLNSIHATSSAGQGMQIKSHLMMCYFKSR